MINDNFLDFYITEITTETNNDKVLEMLKHVAKYLGMNATEMAGADADQLTQFISNNREV